MLLATEVSYGKNEVGILKSELETIGDVAKSQTSDIERYLEKENHYSKGCDRQTTRPTECRICAVIRAGWSSARNQGRTRII